MDPLDVVPLCSDHHADYDARRLDLLPILTRDEQVAAVRHVGIVAAHRRLTSSRELPILSETIDNGRSLVGKSDRRVNREDEEPSP